MFCNLSEEEYVVAITAEHGSATRQLTSPKVFSVTKN